jgi:hypothetical protein
MGAMHPDAHAVRLAGLDACNREGKPDGPLSFFYEREL